jgi:hypothetical protein
MASATMEQPGPRWATACPGGVHQTRCVQAVEALGPPARARRGQFSASDALRQGHLNREAACSRQGRRRSVRDHAWKHGISHRLGLLRVRPTEASRFPLPLQVQGRGAAEHLSGSATKPRQPGCFTSRTEAQWEIGMPQAENRARRPDRKSLARRIEMDKMRYERPVVVELNSRAAHGQGPLACMSGGTVSPLDCFAGSLDTACYVGTGGSEYAGDCVPGTSAAPSASCLSGSDAGYECAGGSNPVHAGSCTSGPAF